MYISEVVIKNYRSLKDVYLKFNKGKNIIIGKNNAGKSNIIKAMDLILGEKYPPRQNFEDKDFFCYSENNETKYSDGFIIIAKLEGNDILENELSKIKGVNITKLLEPIYSFEDGKVNISKIVLYTFDELVENEKHVFTKGLKDKYDNNKTKIWIEGQELSFELINSQECYVYLFVKREEHGQLFINYYFCYKKNDNYYLCSSFYGIKDCLLNTAVIPSFRNPEYQLKVNDYGWYGKLIKSIWNNNKGAVEEEINENILKVTELAEDVFKNATSNITKMLSSAIYFSKVNFKLVNDNKDDIYKGINLYVNDGIDLPFTDKGSGIQSALIIALFSTYCNNFHHNSSLLIAEEPELFLHPQARRVISNEFDNFIFSSGGRNKERQVIISTHSVEFIRNTDLENIILVYKERNTNQSITRQLNINNFEENELRKVNQVIWTKNAEMFFADNVILVEGGEEYLLPEVANKLLNKKGILDYLNTSVIRVNGKESFITYIKILEEFKIPWVIVADLDIILNDTLNKILNFLNINIEKYEDFKDKLGKSITIDAKKFKSRVTGENNSDAQALLETLERISKGELQGTDEEFINTLEYIKSRVKKGDIYNNILESDMLDDYKEISNELRSNNIFIWENGDLEKQYNENAKSINGESFNKTNKDRWAMEISKEIANDKLPSEYLNTKGFKDLIRWCGHSFGHCTSERCFFEKYPEIKEKYCKVSAES